MAPFVRITFTSFDWGNHPHLVDKPFCAVKMKECVLTEQGRTLVQRRRTLYPAWGGSIDAHAVAGRSMSVVLMKSREEKMAEGSVDIMVLAKHCVAKNGSTEFWVDMLPSGTVLLRLQIFTEQTDTSA
ncbi:protein kinase C delta type-like [Sardina pilchardus]|uniref:protein kinase C delta type-like n=1 Tax=Sardina pilchardus TaxID=27697 RepID=UPI002E15907C